MTKATLEQWKSLYKEADRLKIKKPWKLLPSDFLIALQMENYREPFYISIMGQLESAPGIGMAYGRKGFRDLLWVMESHKYPVSPFYVIGSVNSCVCYYGNEEDLDLDQKKRIRDLGLRYKEDHEWTYFLSFEPRYIPVDPDRKQVKEYTEVLMHLNDIMDHIQEDEDFLRDILKADMLKVTKTHNGFRYEKADFPFDTTSFFSLELDDKTIEELKDYQRTDMELVIDLHYFFFPIEDPDYDKPLNPLMILAYDLKGDQILAGDLLDIDEDEMDAVADVFLQTIQRFGLPAKLFARNPNILYGLKNVCDLLDIKVIVDPLEELDDIYEHIQDAM